MAEPLPEPVGPGVGERDIAFRLADPNHRLAGVRLAHELDLPGQPVDFGYDEGTWKLDLPRPPVHRMEYHLTLRYPDGGTETTTDPTNPVLTRGVFGDKSVLSMPE